MRTDSTPDVSLCQLQPGPVLLGRAPGTIGAKKRNKLRNYYMNMQCPRTYLGEYAYERKDSIFENSRGGRSNQWGREGTHYRVDVETESDADAENEPESEPEPIDSDSSPTEAPASPPAEASWIFFLIRLKKSSMSFVKSRVASASISWSYKLKTYSVSPPGNNTWSNL